MVEKNAWRLISSTPSGPAPKDTDGSGSVNRCFSSTHPHIINLLADFEVEADAKMLTNLSEQRDLTITFPYLAC